MNLGKVVEIGILLVMGLALIVYPRIFFKPTPLMSEGQIAKKNDQMRMMGYVLLGVAVLYLFASLTSS